MEKKKYVNPNKELPKEKRALRAKKKFVVQQVRNQKFPEMSLAQCGKLVDGVFAALKDFLKAGVSVTISNFGTFSIQARSPRKARNVRTGETVFLGPTRKVVFIPTPEIKKRVSIPLL